MTSSFWNYNEYRHSASHECTLDMNSNVNTWTQPVTDVVNFKCLHIILKDLPIVHLVMTSSVVKLCFENTANFKMNVLQPVTSRLGILV